MRKIIASSLLFLSMFSICDAQIVINSKFRPLSYDELIIDAMMKAEHDARMKQLYNEYKDAAYVRYDSKDWNGFLRYSQYALDTGWYNAELYYDRGVAYLQLNNFKKAKKEFKKAKKNGFIQAGAALESCKRLEKEYKQRNKCN